MHADLHARFNALHGGDAPLLIANAWDAGSAVLWQHAGAQAIGTSSAALAWSCGHADGGVLPRAALLGRVREIVRVARVPVSVDVEDGYSQDPDAVGALVREVVEAGAVGINLEDGTRDPDLLVAKLRAIRVALDGRPLYINARTDVYLRGLASGEAAVAKTLERLARYAAAGADGAFVPCVTDIGEIASLAAGTPMPLNVIAMPGLPPLDALRRAGVRRISAGEGLYQHAFAAGLGAARRFLDGDVSHPMDSVMPFSELNALFARSA